MDVFSGDLLQAGRPCKPLYKGTLNSAEGLLICLLNKLIFVCVWPWTHIDNVQRSFLLCPPKLVSCTLHKHTLLLSSQFHTFVKAPKKLGNKSMGLLFVKPQEYNTNLTNTAGIYGKDIFDTGGQ